MGAVILKVDENGKIEKEYRYFGDHVLEPVVKKAKELSMSCLAFVMSWGDTHFNEEQMKEILQEIKILRENFKNQDEILEFLNVTEQCANACLSDDYSYLKFEGD